MNETRPRGMCRQCRRDHPLIADVVQMHRTPCRCYGGHPAGRACALSTTCPGSLRPPVEVEKPDA